MRAHGERARLERRAAADRSVPARRPVDGELIAVLVIGVRRERDRRAGRERRGGGRGNVHRRRVVRRRAAHARRDGERFGHRAGAADEVARFGAVGARADAELRERRPHLAALLHFVGGAGR